MRLEALAKKYKTDKFEHGYCPHYERHLSGFSGTLLEVGIHEGASLKVWRDFLPKAEIIGIDISPHQKEEFRDESIRWIIADGTKEENLEGINPDVVIDDGSHRAHDVLNTFNILWPRLPSGGWYIIEDLDVQFIPDWQGTPTGSVATNAIDNKLHALMRGNELSEFHAYEQIVFMKKL